MALASLSPFVLIASPIHVEQQSQHITYINSTLTQELIRENSTFKQEFDLLLTSRSGAEKNQLFSGDQDAAKQSKSTRQVSNKKNQGSQKIVASKSSNYMKLISTGKRNALGNPLYQLQLYANGREIGTYATVSGRTHTQNKNRHQAGTEAPLPDGRYKVARTPIPGTIREAGDRFLPIQPLFQTGRSALGIHYDPSFEKKNGEDGTSGCIGLKNKSELDKVLNYVRTYRPKYLEVNIR